MFIGVAEFLKCPADHAEGCCVLAPYHMDGRSVLHGTVGCPECRTEYPIRGGIVHFARDAAGQWPNGGGGVADDVVWDPETVQALLSLANPGGHVVLVGTATRVAARLARCLEGVHLVGVNAPLDTRPAPWLSLLASPQAIPWRSAVARGVVVGPECLDEHWLGESARVLLRGRRLIAAGEAGVVPGVRRLAAGHGWWVGERWPDAHSS